MDPAAALRVLESEVVGCELCPRLVEHRTRMAQLKRRAFREQEYWGRPLPSFGDPHARLLIVGLAPAAHGGNRTGRMFTGDRSGDYLYRALYETGFANQPESRSVGDGLALTDAWISASVRCAPPDNKPSREEIRTCRVFLEREIELLRSVRVVVALGQIAFANYLDLLAGKGVVRSRAAYAFGHNIAHRIPGAPLLIASYHPSQQNTSTGKLTAPMLREVFERAAAEVTSQEGPAAKGARVPR